MCNCIEDVEKKLNDALLKEYPGVEITEPVELQSKTYILPSFELRPYIPALGRYLDGKRKRKFNVTMNFTFCPFCGVKYE